MPIYEFECRSCAHVWDELQKSSDPDPDQCPNCSKPVVVRRMTAAAFRLKGAGWYETDFKKDGDAKRNLVEGSSGGAAEAVKPDAAGASAPITAEKTATPDKPAAEKAVEKVAPAPVKATPAPTPNP